MENRRRSFTLTELMVAVLIMVVVIIATSKIFGTVSRVIGVGQAGAEVLQEAAAIERQIRADFERLSREGFFAIRCVAVPNDVNILAGGPLLNPALPPTHVLRADQLVFFTQGTQSIQGFGSTAGTNHGGQGSISRVYYGHGFQVPAGPAAELPAGGTISPAVLAIDPPFEPGDPIVPWYGYLNTTPKVFVRTRFARDPTPGSDYTIAGNFGQVDVRQPPAHQWLLTRQALVLADDNGNQGPFVASLDLDDTPGYQGNRIGRSIFPADPFYATPTPEALNGRVDAVASQLSQIRAAIFNADMDPFQDSWLNPAGGSWQRDTISSAIYYPRAERIPPGMHRVDQALGNHVLATACSSFIIDWTYEDGVGFTLNPNGPVDFVGVNIPASWEQRWFGLNAAGDPAIRRLCPSCPVAREGLLRSAFFPPVQRALAHANIDRYDIPYIQGIPDTLDTFAGQRIMDAGASAVYEAIFGYNQNLPLNIKGTLWVDPAVAYTPWPTAIRITVTLHDVDNRLEAGREVQFVIDLPRRQ